MRFQNFLLLLTLLLALFELDSVTSTSVNRVKRQEDADVELAEEIIEENEIEEESSGDEDLDVEIIEADIEEVESEIEDEESSGEEESVEEEYEEDEEEEEEGSGEVEEEIIEETIIPENFDPLYENKEYEDDYDYSDNSSLLNPDPGLFTTTSTTTPAPVIELPPSVCDNFTFGCCEGTEIAAHGLNGLGCCSTSQFGCCADMQTPMEGKNGEGCKPCGETEFGCCPDEETPARGENNQGCGCAHTEFGCCPDSYTSASGPENQGCPCFTFEFGCCRDGETVASGPNLEGCPGCENSEHGCCPDGFTPADGPYNLGCSCAGSEFGCCPDGASEALGPDDYVPPQEVVEEPEAVEESESVEEESEEIVDEDNDEVLEYEDRVDEEVIEEVEDDIEEVEEEILEDEEGSGDIYEDLPEDEDAFAQEGNRYVFKRSTESEEEKIPDFVGCGEIPGEACHLPKDPGTCKENFTVRWFFDTNYGGCSRFWWSGCDGNANRFESSQSCERSCVKLGGSGSCFLPKVAGPCKGSHNKWYFDKQWQKCMPFTYGGCMGNSNRFESQVECQETCKRSLTANLDTCSQPYEPGPCRGNYPRFFYDSETGECKPFAYTGCKGNQNRFMNLEECNNVCKHKAVLVKAKKICALPKMSGPCEEKLPRWFFDSHTKSCMPFYFSGCGGNENNFESLEDCEMGCPNAFPPELEIEQKILVLEEGQEAVLKVTVEANPPPTVTWKRSSSDEDVLADERYEQLEDGSLKISSAVMNDSGVYTVLADNGLGQVARRQITLDVHPSRLNIEVVVDKTESVFEYGNPLKLTCSVKGYPIPVVRWYKNNTPISARGRITVSDDFTLSLEKATPIDGGEYTCRATNKHESVSDSIKVTIEQGEIVKECIDKPQYANCDLIVRGKFCDKNEYYADFCCKSCTEAGQIPPP